MRPPYETYREALRLSSTGITLALCIAIGAGAGMWVDGKLHTEPACTVVGFLLGVVAGFSELVRAVKRR